MRFPKSLRILKRSHFKDIARKKKRFVGQFVAIDFRSGAALKMGLTVPRQYGNAVKRSRFKRLVRESFRHLQYELPSMEMVIFPKRGIDSVSLDGIQQDLREFCHAQSPATASR